MAPRRILPILFIGLLLFSARGGALAHSAGPAAPQAPAALAGTGINYQGTLLSGGSPVTAVCDFQFGLWDAADQGLQQGTTQTLLSENVVEGRIAVTLNAGGEFGPRAFDGSARWLEIAVRCPAGSGSYTPLSPRQALLPAPLALALPGLRTEQNLTSPNVIGGHLNNAAGLGVYGAVIAGGGNANSPNLVAAHYGTVGGGSSNLANGAWSTVSGGQTNAASQNFAVVGGGANNSASGSYSAVGGGNNNTASATNAAIAGGSFNTASALYASVAGGRENNATADSASVAGGYGNDALAAYAAIGGGFGNTILVSGTYAAVGGGGLHIISGTYGFIGGGFDNTIALSGTYATVSGGSLNFASGNSAAVGGGYSNTVSANLATVAGGIANVASGYAAAVGGGGNNSAVNFHGTVAGGFANNANGGFATVGGGNGNLAGDNATVGGGASNTAGGGHATVAGGNANVASGSYGAVGGGGSNTASSSYATVAGGQSNSASGNWAGVGGGHTNSASGSYGAVGGGYINNTSGAYGTVAGGWGNDATGQAASVGGGYANTAGGANATVPGGEFNLASGAYSFAAGQSAHAVHDGAFVWANGNVGVPISSTTNHQFLVRAMGGISLTTNLGGTTGCNLSAGGGTWNCTSDRNAKANFAPVDGVAILNALAGIPIETWNYHTQDAAIRHMGPMAQEWYAAFGLGEGDTTISAVDADGVALAAIQGLYAVVQEKETRIAALEETVANQQAEFNARLRALESAGAPATSGYGQLLGLLLGGGMCLGAFALGRSQRR